MGLTYQKIDQEHEAEWRWLDGHPVDIEITWGLKLLKLISFCHFHFAPVHGPKTSRLPTLQATVGRCNPMLDWRIWFVMMTSPPAVLSARDHLELLHFVVTGTNTSRGLATRFLVFNNWSMISYFANQGYHNEDKAEWAAAQAKCREDYGSNLVIVNTVEENTYVHAFAQEHEINVWIGIKEIVSVFLLVLSKSTQNGSLSK